MIEKDLGPLVGRALRAPGKEVKPAQVGLTHPFQRLDQRPARPLEIVPHLLPGLRVPRRRVVNVPDARRYYAANLEEVVNFLLLSPV